MNLDDKVCYCYHVSLRKLVSFARRAPLEHASQLSDCLGAGTGCGWCIPVLKKIHEQIKSDGNADRSVKPLPQTAREYADARKAYLQSGEKRAF